LNKICYTYKTMKKYKVYLIIMLISLIFTPLLCAQEYDLAAEALFSFGQAFIKEQKYVEAKQEFMKCLMINPRHKQARRLLELCETKIDPEKEQATFVALEDLGKNLKSETPALISGGKQTFPPVLQEPSPPSPREYYREENEAVIPPMQKGAWMLKKGETYAELYTKYYWHNSQFNNQKKKERWDYEGKGNETMSELKLEYGLTDTDTLLFSTVAKKAHWEDSYQSATKQGFTEVKPGIKHLLFTDPFICSLQAKTKFPLHYSEEATPALATHQIDTEFKILTAQSWPKLPGYTKLESGLRLRAEEPSNEIPYFAELGYSLNPNVVLKTTLDGQKAVGGGEQEEWVKYTIGPIFKFKDLFNIEFGFGHTFYGKNTSAAKEVFSSLSCQW